MCTLFYTVNVYTIKLKCTTWVPKFKNGSVDPDLSLDVIFRVLFFTWSSYMCTLNVNTLIASPEGYSGSSTI